MAFKNESKRNRFQLHLEALEKRELLSAWDGLRVTEIMFNPDAPPAADNPNNYTSQDFEFLELQNVGTEAIPLNGARISKGTSYTFGAVTLQPGQFIVIPGNRTAFISRYGQNGITLAAGSLVGGLASTDERILIEYPDATKPDGYATVIDFTYNPALVDDQDNPILDNGNPVIDFWYPITDNGNFSLTLDDPAGMNIDNHDQRDAWRPASERGGTPGRADLLTRSIYINEILAHSDEVNGDWVELYNNSNQPIDVGNWYLSDDLYELKKYQIAADTIIPAHGYLVLNQFQNFGDNSHDPGSRIGFGFSEFGDVAILSSADSNGTLSGIFEERDFGATMRNVSYGRYDKSTETTNFVAMSTNTPGAENAGPLAGPIVISEIMYNPVKLVNGQPVDMLNAEYIELFNISDATVTFQVNDVDSHNPIPWQFTSGIEFVFPLNTSLAPGQRLIIAQNKSVFQTTYGALPDNPQILGPFLNQTALSNKGEKLELGIANDQLNLEGLRTYIRMDRVNYDDKAPWPLAPDGVDGSALVRLEATGYGNDPASWSAAAPLNAPPTIGQLSVASATGTVTLSVTQAQDLDGQIASVRFFHDSNRNDKFDSEDTQLGTDSDGANGWQLNASAASLFNGANQFFAIARDNGGKDSSTVTAQATITAPNQSPSVQALYATPGHAVQGETITLTASNATDADGQVKRCDFYLDSNSNGALDGTDRLLGQDTKGSNGWNWTGATTDFPVGNARVFVRAIDNDNAASPTVSTIIVIDAANVPPVVTALQSSAPAVTKPGSFTLTASGVDDTDGSVTQVAFYLDANSNGQLDTTDTLLGSDADNTNGWSWTIDSSQLTEGVRTFFAQARDNSAALSVPAAAAVTILANQPPVIAGLSTAPAVINPGQTITLTATGVTDPDNLVTGVAFWLDANNNSQIDATDTLLGQGVNNGTTWSLSAIALPTLPAGTAKFLARASDDHGGVSAPASTSLRLNAEPQAGLLTVTPGQIIQGEDITLTLNNYLDSDGAVRQADFFFDANANGLIDSADQLLGTDSTLPDGLSLTLSSADLPVENLRFLARVTDNDNRASATVSAQVLVGLYQVTLLPDSARTVIFTDPDGTLVQLALSKGSATLRFAGAGLSDDSDLNKKAITLDGSATLAEVLLLDDLCQTGTLTVKTKATPGSDNFAELGGLSGTGLKSLSAKTVNLTGAIDLTGFIDTIALNTLADQSAIQTGQANKGLTLTAAAIGDQVIITVNDTLKKLQAGSFTGGSVTARSIGSVAMTAGNLGAGLTTTDGPIGAVAVYGDIAGQIHSASSIKSVTTKTGALTATAAITAAADLGAVATYGDIAGQINAAAIKSIASKTGALTATAAIHSSSDLGAVSTYGNIAGRIEAEGSLKKIASKTGGLNAASVIASGTDIGSVAFYGDIAGQVNAAGSIKSIATKTGALTATAAIQTGSDLGAVSAYGDIAGRIEVDGSLKKIASKSGGLTAASVIASGADIGSVAFYGDIAGQINAAGSIKSIATKSGALDHATLRAGLDLGKLSALDIQSGLISAGRNLGSVLSKTNIVDSLLLCGYDIGADGLGGTADDSFNQTDAVTLKSIKTGKTGYFDGTVALAGVAPVAWNTPSAALAVNPLDQPLNLTGGTIKSAFVGQVWQGENPTPYGLFASTALGKVSTSKTTPSGSDAPGQFQHLVLSQLL